jgi:hypothetical protein
MTASAESHGEPGAVVAAARECSYSPVMPDSPTDDARACRVETLEDATHFKTNSWRRFPLRNFEEVAGHVSQRQRCLANPPQASAN